MNSYNTLLKAASDEIVITKSRFISHASPVADEEEAIGFIRSIREKYRDASHNCYAYIIGTNSGIMRYSDDGEPAGTAGLPMIEYLKAKKLVDCCIVVTRYFGGTLLGTGGLVRAYTEAASIGVNAAVIVKMVETDRYLCEISYSLWDRVNYLLRSLPVRISELEYAASVCFVMEIRSDDTDRVLNQLNSITNGSLVSMKDSVYYALWSIK